MAWRRVYRLLDNIIALNENQIINEILSNKEFQQFIIDLNTEGQLFEKGIDSLGASLGDYTDFTKAVKRIKGQRLDHITLEDTGDFYKSFAIKVQNGGFLITADGQKEDTNLLEEYGKEVLGLTDENLQIVIDAIRQKIIPIIKAKIRS